MILFWFRRDLRIGDNVGLYNALNSGKKVLPVFVFDKNILKKIPKSDARIDFIYKNLQKMQLEFYKYGSSILVAKGNPIELIPKWCEKYKIESVYTNEDYEPYARKRDLEVSEKLSDNGVKFKSFKDQVIFAPNEVLKKDGTPYKVYTPFSKLWISKLESEDIKEYSTINLLNNLHKIPLPNIPTLEEIGFIKSEIKPIEPTYSSDLIDKYDSVRNYPSINGTSRIGVHLRFGTISIRKMVSKAKKSVINTFLKELIWREFFMHILWHFPKTIHSSFKPQYDKIEWINNENDYKRWCDGMTGFPLVDAGMRELNKTGFMHNRIRMLTGSFLCKHLLIDWRWGEAYFAEKLLDYEQSSNVGNWQWVAGCGVDAAPYFRVFNPTEQVKKFDKKHEYIRKWVPEYESPEYPEPIIDHKFARSRCLDTYKAGLKT